MKLRNAAIISTVCVVVAGFAMISPLFFREKSVASEPVEPPQKVLLSFSVADKDDVVDWCARLASLLDDYDMGAVVFFPGELADKSPECIWDFNKKADIGSQTYHSVNLTTISDYSLKLDEIEEGKRAIDEADEFVSKVFMAPFGAIDQDIYSLLERSGILADFSYVNQYNVYEDGKFVRHDALTFQGRDYQPEYFLALPKTDKPVIIYFDNSLSFAEIENYLDILNEGYFEFINASQLAGMPLTIR